MSEQEHNAEWEDNFVEDTQEEEEEDMPEDTLLVDTLFTITQNNSLSIILQITTLFSKYCQDFEKFTNPES